MTTIEVPATIPGLPELGSGSEAMSVTDGLRGAATGLSDVSTWTADHGAPHGWEGGDADAAAHAMTRFSRESDIVAVALERVTRACDTYVTTMTDLDVTRGTLDQERVDLNGEIATLTGRINGATEDQVPELRAEATALASRATRLSTRITRWQERITAAEDRLIRAFREVDTRKEAVRAADSPDRVDAESLLSELSGLRTLGAVTAWWDSLSPAEQEALKIHSPDVIGNTNGLPAGDRDDANRTALQRDLAWLRELQDRGVELTPLQAMQLKNAESAKDALELGATEKDPRTGLPVDTNLLVYLPTEFEGDGAVAVSYGDPDTADNTAVVVPGLTNDGSTIPGQGADALSLFLKASANGESTAAIAWMGYDAPSASGEGPLDKVVDFGGVGTEQLAEKGGHLLSDFVDGLRASDDGERSHLTVIGHSYGSTTAAHSATDGLDADRLVLIGSPGAGGGTEHVSQLNMDEGTVYVGAAERDPVTWLGRDDDENDATIFGRIPNPLAGDGGLGLGEDPSQSSFEALRFPVAEGTELHLDNFYSDGLLGNHTSYLDRETESLDNIATIVRGDQPALVAGRQQDANDYLVDWGKDEAKHQARDAYEAGRKVVTDPVGSFKDAFL